MEHPLSDHDTSKFVDKDPQPIREENKDLYHILREIRKKKVLKDQTLKILESKK